MVFGMADTYTYFAHRGGRRYAGSHLLVELWGGRHLNDAAAIEQALTQAALAARATVLHRYFHPFLPSHGISGVVVLAESHISIHTWPECGYAAIDIFMCASCDPYQALPTLRTAFAPRRLDIQEVLRGEIPDIAPPSDD